MATDPSRVDAQAVLQHTEWLRALATRLLSDEAQAEDVVQRTWQAALEHPPQGSLRAWLATVARNFAWKARRGESRRKQRETVRTPDCEEPSPDEVLQRAEIHQRLVQAVLNLPDPYRTTLLLRFFDDLPPAEVAARLKIPVNTVRTHCERGLRQLRQQLGTELGSDWKAQCALLIGTVAPPVALSNPPADPLGPSLPATSLPYLVLMSLKTKAALAGVLLLVSALTTWVLLDSSSSTQDAPQSPEERQAAAAAQAPDAEVDARERRSPLATNSNAALDENEAAPSNPSGASLTIRVLDVEGRPLAQVPAHLWDWHGGRERKQVESSKPEVLDWYSKLEEAEPETDEQGRLKLVGIPPVSKLYLDLGGQEWILMTVEIGTLKDGDHRDLGEVRLKAGHPVAGIVVDETGTAAPGVTVQLLGTQRQYGNAVSSEDWLHAYGLYTVTDLDGYFRIPAAPAGEHPVALMDAYHGAHQADKVTIGPGHASEDLRLQLAQGARTRVRFVDQDQRAVPDVQVRIERHEDPNAAQATLYRWQPQKLRADTNGVLEFGGVPAGVKLQLSWDLADYLSSGTLLMHGGDDEVVTLTSGLAIRFRVLDAAGQAVAGVPVQAYDERGKRVAGGTANEEGVGSIQPILPGEYTVGIGAWGAMLAQLAGVRAEAGPEAMVHDLQASKDSTVLVRIEDYAGRTPPRVWLNRINDRGWTLDQHALPQESSEGFLFKNVPQGEFQIIASAEEGWTLPPRRLTHTAGTHSEVILRAYHPGDLQVRVLDESGEPAAGITLLIRHEDPELSHYPPVDRAFQTNHGGVFLFRDLVPGRYWVAPKSLWHDFYEDDEGPQAIDSSYDDAEAFLVTTGQTTEVDLHLRKHASLSVEVFRQGVPLPKAEVQVLRGYQYSTYTTDETGSVRLLPLRQGEVQVEVRSGEGGSPRSQTAFLNAGPNQVRFEMSGSEVLGGVVHAAQPTANAKVWLLPAAVDGEKAPFVGRGHTYTGQGIVQFYSQGNSSTTAEDGRFRWSDVPAGHYRLEIRHPNCAPLAGPSFYVDGSRPIDLGDFTLTMGAKLEVFTGEARANIRHLSIQLDGEDAMWADAASFGEGGLLLSGLAPGIHTVSWMGLPKRVELFSDQKATVRFDSNP